MLVLATAFVRTLVLYFLIIAGLRLMGKRQVGELEPAELVLSLLIADLAAVPMQDFGIPLLAGIVPILTLLAVSMLTSLLTMKSVRLRRLLCGVPSVVVRDGKPVQREMRRARLTVDELLEELRMKGCTDLSAIRYAILETNGQLSVLLRAGQVPPGAEALGVPAPERGLPVMLIGDGRVLEDNLRLSGRDRAWLDEQLTRLSPAGPEAVFLLTVDELGGVYCCLKEASA